MFFYTVVKTKFICASVVLLTQKNKFTGFVLYTLYKCDGFCGEICDDILHSAVVHCTCVDINISCFFMYTQFRNVHRFVFLAVTTFREKVITITFKDTG